ncbi:MAG: hypothetical protein KBC73_12380 [Burkholderiaceae bacterium]|nr:hypothetical protein [Burkholderiaceae bacterium]
MSKALNARRAGGALPIKDEGPAVATAAPLAEPQNPGADSGRATPSRQALRVIAGEQQARQYLARLQAQQADPDELALIVARLYGDLLRGFCRVLARAIGGAA